MDVDSLIESNYGGGKVENDFEFTSFELSREGVNFIEAEIERFDMVNQLKSLADKTGVLTNYLKDDKLNIKDKKNLLFMLNQKKIRLSQYSNQ